jgi:hypothetical protein
VGVGRGWLAPAERRQERLRNSVERAGVLGKIHVHSKATQEQRRAMPGPSMPRHRAKARDGGGGGAWPARARRQRLASEKERHGDIHDKSSLAEWQEEQSI